MHSQWGIIILIIPCAFDDKRAASLRWCGQRSFLHCFSFVKWYLPRPFSSSQRPFRYPLTLRIIHRLGLKSKIHNHSVFPSLSLSLFPFISLFPVRLALRGSLLPFAFPRNVLHCVSFLIFPFLCPSSSMKLHRRLYVNSVICKNDGQKCFRGVYFKDS